MREPKQYHSYLLRLWRDDTQGSWRASLQSTRTERSRFFADIGQLWDFIEQTLAGAGNQTDTEDVS